MNEKFYQELEEVKEAERAFLGCLFIDIKGIDTLKAGFNSEVFFDSRNALIFETMSRLHEKRIVPDYITVREELLKSGQEEEAGGIVYISSFCDRDFTDSNLNCYEDIILRSFFRRRLVTLFQEERTKALDSSRDVTGILDEASSRLMELSVRGNADGVKDNSYVINKTIKDIDERIKSNGKLAGIPSGFGGLDVLTQGFMNSEFTVIGARPSMGKTALLLSMIIHAAFDLNIPSLFFSLEMSISQIGLRVLAMRTEIPIYKIRSGLMTTGEFGRISTQGEMMVSAPVYYCDTPNMKLLDLKMEARRAVREKGVRIIYIDYIGLIESPHPDAPVYEQQSEVSRNLKALSRELDVPVIALCQVTRSAEGKEPTLAELRGSGSIEQDADCVMFIHGERTINVPDNSYIRRKLIVAKQRNGPVGTVDLGFKSSIARFVEEKEK